jgi:hypothetical protein
MKIHEHGLHYEGVVYRTTHFSALKRLRKHRTLAFGTAIVWVRSLGLVRSWAKLPEDEEAAERAS